MLGMGAQVRHGNIQGAESSLAVNLYWKQYKTAVQDNMMWGIQNERVDVCQSLAFWADHLTQDT